MVKEPFTPEELDLLNTNDDDIREHNKGLSFDAERARERILKGEPWQQLIQAHLYLDHIVSKSITDALAKPNAMNTGRMGFAQKVQLAEGLALFDDDIIAALQTVNGLRNKIAHDLNFEISEADIRNTIGAVPAAIRRLAKEYEEIDDELPFGHALQVLVLHCEVLRTVNVTNRVLGRKAQLRLRKALLDVAAKPVLVK